MTRPDRRTPIDRCDWLDLDPAPPPTPTLFLSLWRFLSPIDLRFKMKTFIQVRSEAFGFFSSFYDFFSALVFLTTTRCCPSRVQRPIGGRLLPSFRHSIRNDGSRSTESIPREREREREREINMERVDTLCRVVFHERRRHHDGSPWPPIISAPVPRFGMNK